MESLAPLVLFVYNRPEHSLRTLSALKENRFAENSDLFIFSDGPKTNADLESVAEVRKILDGVQGFKSVTIARQDANLGLATSIICGVSQVIKDYGCAIVLEDDLVTSPAFVGFMNDALRSYESDRRVFTISGYSAIEVPADYENTTFFAHISTSWGWATWRDRWESVEWNNDLYKDLLSDRAWLKEIEQKVGNSRIKMLRNQVSGRIDSWAIRRLFSQLKQDRLTLFPSTSLVQNIGFDGTGQHCEEDLTIVGEKELPTTHEFVKLDVRENSDINRAIYLANNDAFMERIYRKLLFFRRFVR